MNYSIVIEKAMIIFVMSIIFGLFFTFLFDKSLGIEKNINSVLRISFYFFAILMIGFIVFPPR